MYVFFYDAFQKLNILQKKNLLRSRMLQSLMEKYGSDKGGKNVRHNYTDVYDVLFFPYKDKEMTLFEFGIQKGPSLRAWRDYFSRGEIYGADIQRGTFFTEDRIHCVYCDQLNKDSLASMWKDLPDMDIIVDDGCHDYMSQTRSFEQSRHKFKDIYVIEDVLERAIPAMEEWAQKQGLRYEWHRLPHPLNSIDNNLLIFYKH